MPPKSHVLNILRRLLSRTRPLPPLPETGLLLSEYDPYSLLSLPYIPSPTHASNIKYIGMGIESGIERIHSFIPPRSSQPACCSFHIKQNSPLQLQEKKNGKLEQGGSDMLDYEKGKEEKHSKIDFLFGEKE
jgi:hypothetical protein